MDEKRKNKYRKIIRQKFLKKRKVKVETLII